MEQSNQQITDRLKQFNSSLDFKRLLGSLMSHWYWFALTLSITLTSGFLYLRYTDSKYEIKSSILIDEGQNNVAKSVLSKLEPENDKSQVNLFNEKVILQSQDLIASVVDSLNFNIRYWSVGRIKKTELYEECPIRIVFDTAGVKADAADFIVKQVVEGQFELREGKMLDRVLYDTWIKRPFGRFKIQYNKGQDVNAGFLDETEFAIHAENKEVTIGRILGGFKVNLNDGRTSLLDLVYTDNITKRGLDFMNVLIHFYQKKELENINLTAQKTREFIRDKKASMMQELGTMDSLSVQIQLTNDMIDPSQTTALMTGKTNSETIMNTLYLQKQALNSLKNSIFVLGSRNQVIAGVGVDDPYLAQLVAQYNAGVQRRDEIARNTGPSNPILLESENELNALKKRILDAGDKVDKSISLRLSNAAQNASDYDSRIRNTPEVNRSIKDVNRNYNVLQSIYLLLYQKDIENEISVSSATNKSKIIVVPFASGAPISPIPKNIYAMMFLLGLMIPGSILVIREMLNNKVINENNIEGLTNIPVIGSVSRVEHVADRDSTIVVGPHIRTGVAEQFRLIRANLEFMSAAHNNRVFMITSSTSGEGKSFISINLGITMTLAKKRVIIMEFDLRKPKISQYLGIPNEGGISGYLAGLNGLDAVIKASGVHDNLYIANCGPIPPNPGELLVLNKTKELISELQEMFDVIIIDTAPIGLVSDALVLSQYAGINLFVIRQNYTQKDQVKMFDVLHKDGKIQNPAIIFNGVEFLKKYGYGYGNTGYGYGYGYAYGYHDDEKTKSKKKKNPFVSFFTK